MKAHRRRALGCHALTAAALAQAFAGATAVFAYETELWGWHRTRVAEALHGTSQMPHEALPVLRQLVAMLGGTMVAWGIAVAWISHVPLRGGERWAGHAILTSLVAWFLLDTGMSITHGVWVNVILNVLAATMVAAPLGLAWPRGARQS